MEIEDVEGKETVLLTKYMITNMERAKTSNRMVRCHREEVDLGAISDDGGRCVVFVE